MRYQPFAKQTEVRIRIQQLFNSFVCVYVFYRSTESGTDSWSTYDLRAGTYVQSVFRFPYAEVSTVNLLLDYYDVPVKDSFRFVLVQVDNLRVRYVVHIIFSYL